MKYKRKEYRKIDLTKLSPIEVYECIMSGKIKKFPNNFIDKSNMKEIIREVVLNRLNLTRSGICKKVCYPYLRKYKLGGSKRAFNSSIYELVTYCFPEMQIKYWELNKVETGFWNEESNREEFMIWLLRKENISPTSIVELKKIDAKLVQKYGGSKALRYGGGLYSLILLVAKIDVKEWQVIKMPVWTEEKVRIAVRWLVEEKLKWTKDQVIENMSAKVFYEHDLGGLLSKYCNHSPIKAIQIGYPKEYEMLKNSKPEYLTHNKFKSVV